jgi:GPI mannosyltransferase 3
VRTIVSWLRRLRPSALRFNEKALLALSLLIVVVTAFQSVTFFHPDEHFQILEFAGLKLGFTPVSALPWEFSAGIRPFLQPALCFAVIRGLQAIGIEDRFAFALALRVLFGTLYWMSIVWLFKAHERELFPIDGRGRRSLYWALFAGFLPYLAVRTSSETFSAALFALGTALLVSKLRTPVTHGAPLMPALGGSTALVAGCLLGLAFEARYQTAIMTLGLAGWLLSSRISRSSWFALTGGFGLALAAGAFCDRWGYGSWCFPAAAYFKANLLQGVAKLYGTSPFFGYLYLPVANIFAPVAVVLLLGLLLTWVRYPHHLLTWVTAPFVVVHSLLAHKEERFLFPIVPFALLALYYGFRPSPPGSLDGGPAPGDRRVAAWFNALKTRGESVAAWCWAHRRSLAARTTLGVNFVMMAVLAIYPLGWRPHHTLYQWVANEHPDGVEWVASGEPYPDYPFFRSAPWNRTVLAVAALDSSGVSKTERPVLLLLDDPFTIQAPQVYGATSATLVYSEFPGYQLAWVRAYVFPLFARLRVPWGGKAFLARTRWYSVVRLER